MSSGGGLLDLVARGKKDTFFTSNPKICHFHSVYQRQPAFTQEIRITQPRNNADWGKYVDFDIEPIGDIVKHFVLLINIPSWLPPEQARQNSTSITSDLNNITYGYTQDIGTAIIDKVQVFNDQILLHEFWGTWLNWRSGQQINSPIYASLQGRHPPTQNEIAKAATPINPIRVNLPIIGNQSPDDKGFPLTAVTKQRFRIRVHLNKLEDLIESSDNQFKPKPWDKTFQQQTSRNQSQPTQFQTLQRYQIKPPTLSLETTQVYIPRDCQEYIKRTVLSLPFQMTQQCIFTVEDNKWLPALNINTIVSIPLPLDFIGPTSRITVGIQSEANQMSNQRYILSAPSLPATSLPAISLPNTSVPSNQHFIQDIRLNMGTIDRINQWSATIMRDVANYYKNDKENRDPFGNPLNIYTLTFGPKETQTTQYRPLGTLNLSRSLEATLYVDLAAVSADPRSNSRKAFIIVYGESWNIFEIRDGQGKVLFAD